MQNARLDESQAGIKTARSNTNNLIYADDTIVIAESKEEIKSFLRRVKEDSEKADLKLNIQKRKSWDPVSSLHGKQKGKKWKQQQVLSSWASKSLQKVTAAMKLKMLAPWKESYDKPRKHMKSRDIILLTKIPIIVKAMVFPVVMYGCESWIIKKTEH